MEQIAIDQSLLLHNVIPVAASFAERMRAPKLKDRMIAGADAVLASIDSSELHKAALWESDTARGWAAMSVGQIPNLSLAKRLELAKIFALDSHFSVREWAWISVRPFIADDLINAIDVLGQWSENESDLIRRFASEATRPRGVWCKHITRLKQDPELAIELIEHLRSDESRYVQLSVGNWLNDASKSQPDWVLSTCSRWLENETPSTRFICNRGMRSFKG